MLLMKIGSGNPPSSIRSTSNCLPRFHVVISTNSAKPAITGNAPPCRIFGTLAAKYTPSTRRKPNRIGTTSTGGHFHSNRITADTRILVISMVPVTATP
ncbi:hypothetical protein D3C81_1638450 [compost metagenome]